MRALRLMTVVALLLAAVACSIMDPGDHPAEGQMEALEEMVDDWEGNLNAQYEDGLATLFEPDAWVYSPTKSQWTFFLPEVEVSELQIDPVAEEVAEVEFLASRAQGETWRRMVHWDLIETEGRWLIQDETWRSP